MPKRFTFFFLFFGEAKLIEEISYLNEGKVIQIKYELGSRFE